MTAPVPIRFPIRFDGAYAAVSSALFLPPSKSYVEVLGEQVSVRMAWGFRASFERSAVVSMAPLATRPISRGVHGFGGRWLVNGSGDGILVLQLQPEARGYVIGVPVRLRELAISVNDPAALVKALAC